VLGELLLDRLALREGIVAARAQAAQVRIVPAQAFGGAGQRVAALRIGGTDLRQQPALCVGADHRQVGLAEAEPVGCNGGMQRRHGRSIHAPHCAVVARCRRARKVA